MRGAAIVAALTCAAIVVGCGGSSGSSSSASSPAGSSIPAGRVSAAPPPTPSGTPAAPAGLRQTTGYGMYEGCAGHCSGAVPASLRRPLRLPSTCAASTPGGSVRPTPLALTVMPFVGSAWAGARVTWHADASYSGPVLIRGRQVGGSGAAAGFGEGHVPYDELQLLQSGQGAPGGPGRSWFTFTRVRKPGCYAYQVDGTGFSEVIVFRAAR